MYKDHPILELARAETVDCNPCLYDSKDLDLSCILTESELGFELVDRTGKIMFSSKIYLYRLRHEYISLDCKYISFKCNRRRSCIYKA